MNEVNFNELLGVQVQSVERPKNFPVGPYSAIVASHEFGKSSQKETPYVRFWVKLLGPGAGVEMELFEEAGGVAELGNRKPIKLDFYLTKDAIYRLREFLENTLELSCSARNFDEVIPESTNMPLTAVVTHQAGQKEGEFWMNITDHMKAE